MNPINQVDFSYSGLEEAFPPCEPGISPFGSRVLLQIRSPKKKTKGGIILIDEARETEHYNTQTAKVLACGPLAFHNRTTLERWPEGAWAEPGDYVRIPRYGGDRWSVKPSNFASGGDVEEAILVIFNDLDLIGKVTGDPLAVKAFL